MMVFFALFLIVCVTSLHTLNTFRRHTLFHGIQRLSSPHTLQASTMPLLSLQYDQLKAKLRAGILENSSAANIPPEVLTTLSNFVEEYIDSNLAAGFAVEQCSQSIQVMVKEVTKALKEPHKFSAFHKAIRSPFDYYAWANDFFRPLVKFERSRFIGEEHAHHIHTLLARGDNVVFLSNHQTEADPQVISLLFETSSDPVVKSLAEKMIFLAGHKVTTDPIAIPFSMGRNLICIHSKKHIKNPPEEAGRKQQENLVSMQVLGELFAQGGQCMWVAPSGGRDRTNLLTEHANTPEADTNNKNNNNAGERFVVSPFDSKVLDMFRLLAMQSGKSAQTHFYPMAMFTHQLVPPPKTVSSGIGETRSAQRGEVSIHILPETEGLGGLKDKEFCDTLQRVVEEAYEGLHQWHYPQSMKTA